MKRIYGFVMFSLIFVINAVFAAIADPSIQTITSMQQVEKYVDKHALVLFDLDHTVFEGKNYGYGHANWFYDQYEIGLANGLDEKTIISKIFPHWLHSQKSSNVKPVESITPALIKKLQNNGILVLGLTGRQLPLVDITLNQLKGIDVDFNSPSLPKENIRMQFTAPTIMKEGVIFCSDYNEKGVVLKAYLAKLNIHPKKIIFIDDSKRNIKSVIEACTDQAEIIGLYYPLVAEFKKQNWDAKNAHQAYCDAYRKNPELHHFPLDCQD